MRGIQTRGLAIGLMAAGLSVLGIGSSSATTATPADHGGEHNAVTELTCTVQNAVGQGQGDCGSAPGAQPAGGGEGSESPVSELTCMVQNALGQGQGDCGSAPGDPQQPSEDSPGLTVDCLFDGGVMDCAGLNPNPQK
jgi:hypothetical protein